MFRLTIIFFLIINFSIAQNLVPNPGFENAWTCPESFTKERIKDLLPKWFVPNLGTPDYFNKCNHTDVGIPENFTGSMISKEGNAYIGLILKESFNPYHTKYEANKDEYSREYISAKLIKPLKYSKLYCVSFNYCLAKLSDYAVDCIGVYFSKDKLKVKNDGIILAKQQIFKKGKLLKSKNKWEEFCGVIMARGGEKYITIGNFSLTKEVQYIKIDSTENEFMSKYAYYLIDNVKVFPIENEFECGCSGDDTEVLKDYTASGKDKNSKNNQNNTSANKDTSSIKNINKSGNKNISSKDDKSNNNIQGVDNIKEVKSGISVTLNNIFFALEESKLTEESFVELDKLVALMVENPDIEIEISGHSDNTGSDEFNMKLSKERAKAVADYLRTKKIRKKRLSWNGYGNTIPLTSNDTEEGRTKNRRVEFKIIKKN